MKKAARMYLFIRIISYLFAIFSLWLYSPTPWTPEPALSLWGDQGRRAWKLSIFPNLKPFDKFLKEIFMKNLKKKIK